ncbi:MAG: lipid-A-disaccharide synthase N-terminal domain-containing protein [Spirochaetes bacterium]|nr:lipid-A-disaccharide synthase N-terminal domain-containing protein [Spirochaetota bacterium]
MNWNWWIILGFTAQALFSTRFLIQWIVTEKKKKSHIPVSFWYFSLFGGILLLIYSIHKKDPVFILGQSTGVIIYARNLYFIYTHKKTPKGSA